VYNIRLFVPRFCIFCVIFMPNCLPLSSEIFRMICYVKDGEIQMMNWYLVLLFSFLGSEIKKYQSKTKRGQMARFLKKYLSKNNKLYIVFFPGKALSMYRSLGYKISIYYSMINYVDCGINWASGFWEVLIFLHSVLWN
jgi:hypothetical protein